MQVRVEDVGVRRGSGGATSPSYAVDELLRALQRASTILSLTGEVWSGRVPDVLIYADTVRSPELRHEVPIGDPRSVPLRRARRRSSTSRSASMEIAARSRRSACSSCTPPRSSASTSCCARGLSYARAFDSEVVLRAVKALGITSAAVPATFPLWLGRPAARGRRRARRSTASSSTSGAGSRPRRELAGIRRAQRAAEAGMDAARDLLRRATPNGGGLEVDGAAADGRAREGRRCSARSPRTARPRTSFIVSHGRAGRRRPRHGLGADPGGRADRDRHLAARQRVVLFCRHDAHVRRRRGARRGRASGTGSASEALDRAIAEIKAGRHGRAIFDGDVRDLRGGRRADAAHEGAGRAARERLLPRRSATASGSRCTSSRGWASPAKAPLMAGDVVDGRAGPATGRASAACGSRTSCSSREDGAENLTQYPYDLAP